ncbi:Uncharacterised protein g2302 [Pycnogonum litorale]
MDIDDVFHQIGGFGHRQRLYFAMLSLKETYLACPIMHIVFSCIKPHSFQCVTGNGTVYHSRCPSNDVRLCESVGYQTESSSIITEWNLICSESYKVQLSQSIYMCGVLCGAILFGYVSDAIGRLKTYILALSCTVFFTTLSSFSSSYWIYVTMRFLAGINIQGAMLTGYVLLVELIGSSVRGLVSAAYGLFFTTGALLVTSIAYLIRDWRMMTLVSTLWGVPFVLQYFIVPESPRWLLTNGYQSEAQKVLKHIAKGNGKCESLSDDIYLKNESNANTSKKDPDSLKKFFTNCHLFKLIIIQLYSWFVTSSMYYGLTLAAGDLGDIYTSNCLMLLVEFPATFLLLTLINRIGRRKLLCGFMLLGGVSCLTIQLLPSYPNMYIIRVFAALVGKFCSSVQFCLITVHSAEIFPTSVRNGAMGTLAVASRIGGIVCPFIVLLGQYVTDLHFTIFGFFAFTSGICNLWLPETKDKQLPDTIDNMLDSDHDYRSDQYKVKELNIVNDFDNGDADFIDYKDTEAMLPN